MRQENSTEFIPGCTPWISLHGDFPLDKTMEIPCTKSQWGEASIQIQFSGLCLTTEKWNQNQVQLQSSMGFPHATPTTAHTKVAKPTTIQSQSSMSSLMLHQHQIKTKQDGWRVKDGEQDECETKWWTRHGCEMQWWTDRHEVELKQADGQTIKTNWSKPTEPKLTTHWPKRSGLS